jgi:hypothetical protein
MAGGPAHIEVVETAASTPAEELIVLEELGLSGVPKDGGGQSVGWSAVREPDLVTGLIRLGEHSVRSRGAPAITPFRMHARHRTRDAGPLPPAERVLRNRQRAEVDVKRPVAVVGVGQTHHGFRRADLSIPASCARRSIAPSPTAGSSTRTSTAVVIGRRPISSRAVMQPEQFLAGALGAHRSRSSACTPRVVGASTGAHRR